MSFTMASGPSVTDICRAMLFFFCATARLVNASGMSGTPASAVARPLVSVQTKDECPMQLCIVTLQPCCGRRLSGSCRGSEVNSSACAIYRRAHRSTMRSGLPTAHFAGAPVLYMPVDEIACARLSLASLLPLTRVISRWFSRFRSQRFLSCRRPAGATAVSFPMQPSGGRVAAYFSAHAARIGTSNVGRLQSSFEFHVTPPCRSRA